MEIDHPIPETRLKDDDLYDAAERGDALVIKSLSENHFQRALSLRNEDGRSLLHVAASSGHVEGSEAKLEDNAKTITLQCNFDELRLKFDSFGRTSVEANES
ncbi:hypothetical protein Scep_012239 [Stephania cephalantha]|uniref:Uncharacterized protein n=1 Tax=Stephania cephalantha TaxID=152367 RepID=A0AAP0JEK6_9MAGN